MNENMVVKQLNVKNLLSQDCYRIPIYQRNYDWGEKEATQLVADIADYASDNNKKSLNYYIGSLVVFERSNEDHEKYFETIDGQQRLTTLTLLMCSLKNSTDLDSSMFSWLSSINLSYDYRSEADESLNAILNGKENDIDCLPSMKEVYRVFQKNLISIARAKDLTIDDFTDYLLNHVIIQRIPVPKDTQLNHYFEIMNSRGEQLEKHEVLKASLMHYLDVSCHQLFNDIWEACSDMNSYVQMGFSADKRDCLFGENWEDEPESSDDSFDSILEKYRCLNSKNEEDNEVVNKSISELIEDANNNIHYKNPYQEENKDDECDRFSSIINFPNFLLHVLKIRCVKEFGTELQITKSVMLDDKRLIDFFTNVIEQCDDKEKFVKEFIIDLLYIRTLLDKYVIKRENHDGRDGWSLKRTKQYKNKKGRKINYVATFNRDDKEEGSGE